MHFLKRLGVAIGALAAFAVSPVATARDAIPEGAWTVKVAGTQYGPFRDRTSVIMLSAPDARGFVTGYTPGRTLMLVAKSQPQSRTLRGLWMERTALNDYAPTGRWGLVELRFGGDPASSIDARFSIGYREPNVSHSKEAPGLPGMRATGSRVADAVDVPVVHHLRRAWSTLTGKPSPFPAIHGVWPTGEIDAAIRAWMEGGREATAFGGSQATSPCAATCMGVEPRRLLVRASSIQVGRTNEKTAEIGGAVSVAARLVSPVGGTALTGERGPYLFRRTKDNALSSRTGENLLLVDVPPLWPGLHRCQASLSLGQQNYTLPAGAWSDPLSDLYYAIDGTMQEFGVGDRATRLSVHARGSDNAAPGKGVKAIWSELDRHAAAAPARSGTRALADGVCFRDETMFRAANGRTWSKLYTDITVR